MQVVRDLLKHGAKVEIADNDGWTTLKSASTKGHMDVVQELKHGASL